MLNRSGRPSDTACESANPIDDVHPWFFNLCKDGVAGRWTTFTDGIWKRKKASFIAVHHLGDGSPLFTVTCPTGTVDNGDWRFRFCSRTEKFTNFDALTDRIMDLMIAKTLTTRK